MTRFASLLVLGLSLVPAAAAAQKPTEVQPGAAVRVWTSPTAPPFVGKVLSQDGTSMFLKAEGFDTPITVTRNTITRIDLSRGRRSRRTTVLYGMLVGAAAGFVLGQTDGHDWPGRLDGISPLEKSLLLNILTVPAGALVGALIGPGPERWTTIPAPSKGSLLVAPPSPSLRLTLRF